MCLEHKKKPLIVVSMRTNHEPLSDIFNKQLENSEFLSARQYLK